MLKNKFKILFTIFAFLFVQIFCSSITFSMSPVEAGAAAAHGDSQPMELFGDSGIFVGITNTLLFIVGALSVIMLIIGGFRYVVSAGNASAVTNAKNTILYAIVGLIIALLAYAAINFVLTALIPGTSSSWTNV